MSEVIKKGEKALQDNSPLHNEQDLQFLDLDGFDKAPIKFVRTSLMVHDSKYLIIKILAAYRGEEIRQCLDEALLCFISSHKTEVAEAIAWHMENEKRRRKRG